MWLPFGKRRRKRDADDADHRLHVVTHSARVALLASWLARELGVGDDRRDEVWYAARLHEVGMISVPSGLVGRPAPLTRGELRRVREQARVGAEMARSMGRPLSALLIEHQYDDYDTLRRTLPRGSDDALLAGIFRVADVLDAMTAPRPYQPPVPEGRRLEVLREGSGTRFHPEAVRALLGAWPGPG